MVGAAVDRPHRTNDRVGELSKAAAPIGDVVELTDNIAAPDQSVGTECDHRGGVGRRCRAWFRGCRLRSESLGKQTEKATGEIG
jgi:methyl-accepting chemotaxis protein